MAIESVPAGDGEYLLQEFLTAVHTTPPSQFLALVDRYAVRIGLRRGLSDDATILLLEWRPPVTR
ncbi:hypothetical protein [Streptomyces sp. NPDC054765]